MIWTKETKKNLKIISELGSTMMPKTKPVVKHVADYIRANGGHLGDYLYLKLPGGNILAFHWKEPKPLE
jgi:phenylacetate-coenzyme A ligase PaaK-like adenylate-forming protein